MVRMERLELSRREALEPKSSVYTNFTTSAQDWNEPATALTLQLTLGVQLSGASGKKWGGRWDSNPRRLESQSRALPTELRPPQLVQARLAVHYFPILPWGAIGRRGCTQLWHAR